MRRFGMEVMWIYTSTQIRCMSSMLVPSWELLQLCQLSILGPANSNQPFVTNSTCIEVQPSYPTTSNADLTVTPSKPVFGLVAALVDRHHQIQSRFHPTHNNSAIPILLP